MVPFKRREGGDDNADDEAKGKADPDAEAVPAIPALRWFYAETFVAVVFGHCLGVQTCHHTLGLAKPMQEGHGFKGSLDHRAVIYLSKKGKG